MLSSTRACTTCHMLRVLLLQAALVLKSNGKIFLCELYRYDPYRRLSEVRDYFRELPRNSRKEFWRAPTEKIAFESGFGARLAGTPRLYGVRMEGGRR